jgi:hypothetical protein
LLKTDYAFAAQLWHTIIKKGGVLEQFSLFFRQCVGVENARFLVGCFDVGVMVR